MSTGRKISVRKILQTLVTLVVICGCTLAILSADRQQNAHHIKDVQLRVLSRNNVRFLDEEMVADMLFASRHIDPKKLTVTKVDEGSMEAILKANPWVGNAQVYVDNDMVLHISVSQRVPKVRLFEVDGNSYYLDADLKSMPLSTAYTPYVPVVTGVPPLNNDSISTAKKGEILGLVKWLGRDTFWNAQISQISMRPDGGFELMPIIGRQRIILGDTSRLQQKLTNLFAFYKQVQNNIGWDKYSVIDLRYEGQIVVSPALKWKAPAASALSNMDWVKAILESAPARQDLPGGDASAYADSVAKTAQPQAPTSTVHTPASPAKAQTKAQRPKPVLSKPTSNNSRQVKNNKSNAAAKH